MGRRVVVVLLHGAARVAGRRARVRVHAAGSDDPDVRRLRPQGHALRADDGELRRTRRSCFSTAIGGKRQDIDFVAQRFAQNFVVLSFDARGHGQSGGLTSIDGPNEVADARTVHDWLAAQPEVIAQRDRRLGHLHGRRRGAAVARRRRALERGRGGRDLDRPLQQRSLRRTSPSRAPSTSSSARSRPATSTPRSRRSRTTRSRARTSRCCASSPPRARAARCSRR